MLNCVFGSCLNVCTLERLMKDHCGQSSETAHLFGPPCQRPFPSYFHATEPLRHRLSLFYDGVIFWVVFKEGFYCTSLSDLELC